MTIEWERLPADSQEFARAVNNKTLVAIDRTYDGPDKSAEFLYYRNDAGYFYKIQLEAGSAVPQYFRSKAILNW